MARRLCVTGLVDGLGHVLGTRTRTLQYRSMHSTSVSGPPRSFSEVPHLSPIPMLGTLLKLTSVPRVCGRGTVPAQEGMDAAMLHFYHETEGPIYRWDMPGQGADWRGTIVVCKDPNEMLKMTQNEGKYPAGITQQIWPWVKAMRKENNTALAILSRGEEWWEIRQFMQKGLLSPAVARSYIPGMVKAAALASKGLPACADAMPAWTSRAAFDMFGSVMFGQLMETADPSTPKITANVQFCEEVLSEGDLIFPMLTSPWDIFANTVLDIDTPKFKQMQYHRALSLEHSSTILNRFLERRAEGELNEFEKNSYFANALGAQEEIGAVSHKQLLDISQFMMSGALDTTSSVLSFVFLQLAIHPAVQEKLAQELAETLHGADLDADLTKGKTYLPYTHAVIRESHRMRPPTTSGMVKDVPVDVTLGGFNIPAGTRVQLDIFSVQNDREIIPDALEFRPERWLPDAVAERVGTPAEVLDHTLLRGPFSAGARMCPGARVAHLDILCLLTRVVQDWKFELEDKSIASIYDVPYKIGLVQHPVEPAPRLVVQPRAQDKCY